MQKEFAYDEFMMGEDKEDIDTGTSMADEADEESEEGEEEEEKEEESEDEEESL